MKTNYKIAAIFIALMYALSIPALAATSTVKSFSLPGVCDYGPDTGYLSATFGRNQAATYFEFSYSASDAAAIGRYKAVYNQYAGVDIKNVPSNYSFGLDMMEPYSISTNMPNPKTDLENNDILGTRNDEAEVVALGTIQGDALYKISVMWNDYRTGASSDYGEWRINAELSEKGIIDYNTIDWSPIGTVPYGTQNGLASIASPDDTDMNCKESTMQSNIELMPDDYVDYIPATITFAQYLSFEELAAFIDTYGITVVQLQLRGLEEDGTRVSIFTRTDKGLEETKQILDNQAIAGRYTIVGITGLHTMLNPDTLLLLKSDSKSFLVDTYLDQPSAQRAVDSRTLSRINILREYDGQFPQSKTWELEDSGLLKHQFKTK